MKNEVIKTIGLVVALIFLATNPVMGDNLAEFEGLIEPFQMVNVGTPVDGVVAKVNVKRSSTVEKGDPLVILESSVENAVVERARVLAAAEGELKLQREKLAFAKRMQTRVEELYESDAISAEKTMKQRLRCHFPEPDCKRPKKTELSPALIWNVPGQCSASEPSRVPSPA